MPPTIRERKLFVWEWVDLVHPDAWESPAVLAGLAGAATAALLEEFPPPAGTREERRRAHSLRTNWLRSASRWLADPVKHSPYIDKLAVQRALEFEWSVVDALTEAEREIFYDTLAAMDDPYEWRRDWTIDLYYSLVGEAGDRPTSPPPSPRRVRWMSGSATQRDAVQAAVSNRHHAVESIAREAA